MAKPYTHINNDLLKGLARLKISGTAFNVLIAIIVNTLSFHRNQHELSNGYLMKATGLNERTVIRAMHELERKKIIKIVSKNCGSHPRMVRILTDKIVTLTKAQGGTDKNVSNITDKSAGVDTVISVSQEIKEETKEQIKDKERKPSFFNRQPTLAELAARSQAEKIDEDDGYEYL